MPQSRCGGRPKRPKSSAADLTVLKLVMEAMEARDKYDDQLITSVDPEMDWLLWQNAKNAVKRELGEK